MKSNKVDYQQTLRHISRSMVRLKRPERLLKIITRLVDRLFGLTHASILILNEEKKHFMFADSKGERRIPVGLIRVDLDHPLAKWFQNKKLRKLFQNKDYLYRPVLKRLLSSGMLKEEEDLKLLVTQLLKAMDNFKVEMVVPGFFKENLLGMLLLGKKFSDRCFTFEEISFLQILVQDCSMAVKTAQYHRNLEERNMELAKQVSEIEAMRKKEHKTYYEIMRCLANEVYAKDAYTFGHVNQVERLGLMIGREMGIDLESRQGDILAAGLILHDVGKIGIPDAVLKKNEKLNEDEWKIMKTHSEKGYKILQPLSDFKEVAEIVLSHHENFDGTGYPRGLKGEQIPLAARIVSVADSFHAIVSTRCYSKGKSVEYALDELQRCAGTQFDPVVVQAFVRAMKREMKKRGVGFFEEEERQAKAA